MSVFKQKNSIASVEFKKFKGIDTTAPHREVGAAYDMVNFRVLPDGSLQKRSGFQSVATFNEKVRGVWSGKIQDKTYIFTVHGKTVTRSDPSMGIQTDIGKINTSSGNANFMFFNGYLYLSDGRYFYIVKENGVSTAEGYAPLYGKDWPVRYKGEVNEPINVASRHIRMSYLVNEELSFLCVDHNISLIDAIYVNDVLITDTSRYFFDQDIMCICLSGLKIGDRVMAFLTVDESEINMSDVWSCQKSVVYGDYTDNILFLFDGNRKNAMYASCSVSEKSLQESKFIYPNSLPFYVPDKPAFKMPKQEHRITAVCRQYDRLLIFTEEDTWMGNLSASPTRVLEAVTINPSYGCTSVGGAAVCENEPVCVSDGQILRWTSEADELNECNAYNISSKIESMLPPSFFANALVFVDKRRTEILFFDTASENGTLWIYNYKTKDWYKFEGISANSIFAFEGSVGFTYLNSVCLFNDSIAHDELRDGSWRIIEAFYESLPTDLSVSSNKKRLCGMTLNANLHGEDIRAEYLSEGQVICSLTLKSESSFPTSFIKRLNSRRFCYTSLRLKHSGNSTPRIYSTGIWAKP